MDDHSVGFGDEEKFNVSRIREMHKEIPEPFYSPESHAMNVGIAVETKSTNAAFIFNHIIFWVRVNKQKGTNYHEERTWMYQSIPEIACHFPYLSEQQIRDAISILVKHNYILKGNFNENKFDRTNWYALKNEGWLSDFKKISPIRSPDILDSLPRTDQNVSETSCYKDTDNKTYNNKDNMSDPSIGLASFFLEKIKEINPKIKNPDLKKWSKEFSLMMKTDGHSDVEIRKVIEYVVQTKNKPSGNGFCWANVILSPSALRSKFAQLWGEIDTKPVLPEMRHKEDERIASKIWETLKNKRVDIRLGYNYIEFINGPQDTVHLKFGEKDFREKCLEQLHNRNIKVEKL